MRSNRFHAFAALPLLFVVTTCMDPAARGRTFCVKIYLQGQPAPAECNSKEVGPIGPSDGVISITLPQGGSRTLVVETVLLTGGSGKANVYAPAPPGGAFTFTAPSSMSLPGTTTVTARRAGGSASVWMIGIVVEDDETEIEVQVGIEVILTTG